MNGSRGMPDVSISQQTQDKIIEEEKVNEKKPNSEIFKNPNLEMKVITKEPEQVKVIDEIDEIAETAEPPKKPKKKLTEKQLEALARGRQKSMETRIKKKEDKQSAKAQKEQKFEYQEPEPIAPPTQRMGQQPQFIQKEIDYDKIINGVANVYEERLSKKKQAELEAEQKQQAVQEQVGEFEEKIREDERRKVKEYYDEQKKLKKQEKAQAVSHNVLSRPSQESQDNPYSYAFSMNARNRFSRY